MVYNMKKDEQILEMAKRDIEDHLIAKQKWRDNYVKPAFAMYDGDQWESDAFNRQIKQDMPTRTINKVASVVDAVAGFEVQNRADIEAIPVTLEPDSAHIETANNGLKWCEATSDFDYESSMAFSDLLKCGVGATFNYISYMDDPNGIMKTERIFPLLFLFDPATRRMNMMDSRWRGFAELIDLDSAKEEAGIDINEPIGTGIDDGMLLDYFDTLATVSNITLRYEYQWREVEHYWRVNNTLPEVIQTTAATDQLLATVILNYLNSLSDRLGFDPRDSVFTIEKEDYGDVKKAFESFGVDFSAIKQKRYVHMRAKILGDRVIEKGMCLSPSGFDINPMTAKYSEIHQSHYAMVHSMKDAQRILNQTISDFEGYLSTIPKGGVEIEETATNDMEGFMQTWHKAREITVYADGALSQGRVRPKQAGVMPQGIGEMIQLMLRLIPEVSGVTPDFMGIYDNAQEVSGVLQAQRIRQGLTVLAIYMDAKQRHSQDQGKTYLAGLRILAENAPGRLLRNILGESSEKFLRLNPDNLASEYIIEIKPMAQTPNERQELFSKLVEIGSMLENSGKTAAGLSAILPVALPYSSFAKADTDKIVQALTPPPAPQPDPVNQAYLQSETNYKNSIAAKNAEETKQISLDNLLKLKKLESYDEEVSADVIETMSRAELNAKKADITLPKTAIGRE